MARLVGTVRTRGSIVVGLVSLVSVVMAGCSGGPNVKADVVGKAAVNSVPTIPACAPDQVSDTKAYVASYAKNLITSQDLRTGWNGGTKLIDVPTAVDAATKTAMLPCIPAIDVTNSAANPSNVATIQNIISPDLWAKLIIPDKVGAGNQKEAPKVTGFSDAATSYKAFLTSAARMPYFCGEKGKWATVEQACERELSTFFAHAIQETGEKPVPPGEELWQSALFQTREGTCWPNVCDQYNGGAENFDAPKDVSYYGRGIKQLSWAYNYASFSASYYGDMDVLINQPDRVATDVDLVLGSGIWFAMQPQPKKPSMHDVVTGTFQPHDMPASGEFKGVTQQEDGSIFQKFAATVSIINGAYECSPTSSGEALAMQLQQSKNRFVNYKTLLLLFGVPEKDQTKNEKEILPGETYCTIANGSPWGEADAAGKFPLGWEVPFLLDMGNPNPPNVIPGSCFAVGYGQLVSLPISAPGSYKVCSTQFMGGNTPTPSPTAPTATPTEPTASPSPTTGDEKQVVATSADGKLSVTIARTGDGWASGYCTQVTAQNVKGPAIDKWNVSFQLGTGQTLNADGWDSTVTPSSGGYIFQPAPWSAKIGPGITVNGGGFCIEGGRSLPTGLQVSTTG